MGNKNKNKNKIDVTDIDKVRVIAIGFLCMPIRATEIPVIASHPFIDGWFVAIWKDGKQEIVDLHDEENFKNWQNQLENMIWESDLNRILLLMHKAYILPFLSDSQKYISREDMGIALRSFWGQVEYPSYDNSPELIINLFKKADKSKLMDKDELDWLNNAPEKVKVYRGVTEFNKDNKQAVSWTLDNKVAIWFSHRFSHGTNEGEVWEREISKDKILCYFNNEEQEVIVNLLD